MIEATLCQVIWDGKLLLQRKSAGRFGEGKWNGPGGKVQEGETPLQCVIREVQEETGLTIRDPVYMGVNEFYFGQEKAPDWLVHVYVAECFTGALRPSEEGELRWFSLGEIPYGEMWQDDTYWLPVVLGGKRIEGRFVFTGDGSRLVSWNLTET